MADTFPRQYARTRRFTLGDPRGFRVSPDDLRVVFLRSRGGSDPLTCVWVLDVGPERAALVERLVSDPLMLMADLDGELPAAERARRERLRESADGITAFATDQAVTRACFTIQGQLFVTSLLPEAAGVQHVVQQRAVGLAGVFDPRLSPDGSQLAYLTGNALRVCRLDPDLRATDDRLVAADDDPEVTWGQADFNAAEEFDRYRGYWWAPDSSAIVAARVDNRPVQRWHIADPAHPEREPSVHRYPAAGTANAEVTLTIFPTVDAASEGGRLEVQWDPSLPYLIEVLWTEAGLHVVVMDRAQTRQTLLRVDPTTGTTTVTTETTSAVWVERPPGTPAWRPDGGLVTVRPVDDRQALFINGERSSEPGVHIRRVAHVAGRSTIVCANTDNSWEQQAIMLPDGRVLGTGGAVDVIVGTDVAVVRQATMEHTTTEVIRVSTGEELGSITSFTEVPLVDPKPTFALLGARGLPVNVLLPNTPARDYNTLPVLMNPYGGPHAQMVIAAKGAHNTSQWLADQGFAVVVVDGRGTPGRGVAFEQAVHLDLAQPVLDDQVEGLLAAAERYPQLDLSRVGIRGWSFGGYLAALAVLRRPDVFHAAVAGAPVTEWRLYDTGYTERYLGNPTEDPGPYDRCSLLLEAHKLARPLMLVHGLADDNVVAAHTLQFSSALLAAGKPHEVLPLSGVTHMTPQEVVAENLLLLQVEFLKRHLGVKS